MTDHFSDDMSRATSLPHDVDELWKHKALEVFESKAERYATHREQEPGFRCQLEIVFWMLEAEKGQVLDLGCASGVVVQALHSRGFRAVGVDFSPKMITYAQHRVAPDGAVRFLQADAEYLPFRGASFDHILCLGVLEYLHHYEGVVAEIARVVRPGGLALLSVPSRISPYYVAYRVVEPVSRLVKRLLGIGGNPNQKITNWNTCIPWRLRQLLRSHGLEPHQDAYSNFFIFPFDRIWPAVNDWLAGMLEPCRKFPLVSWTASQYLVSARKRGVSDR